MSYDPQTKIGDIVLEAPATMRIFESLNIDYCCGGQRSLAAACAHAGMDLAVVLARLKDLQAAEFLHIPGDGLIDTGGLLQRCALGARAGALGAGEYQMKDVLEQVIGVAGRDEPLHPVDVPGAVVLLDGLGAAGADVGTGVRLC